MWYITLRVSTTRKQSPLKNPGPFSGRFTELLSAIQSVIGKIKSLLPIRADASIHCQVQRCNGCHRTPFQFRASRTVPPPENSKWVLLKYSGIFTGRKLSRMVQSDSFRALPIQKYIHSEPTVAVCPVSVRKCAAVKMLSQCSAAYKLG